MTHLCPMCKTSYPSDVKFCIHDGARLVYAEDPFEQQTSAINNPFDVNNPFEKKPTGHPFYTKASIGNRLLAALLDGLIFVGLAIPGAVVLVFAFIAAYGNEEKLVIVLGIIGILLILIPIAYQLLKDGFGMGQSYGKRALDLVVINLDTNTPCDKTKSFTRNLVSLLLGLVPFVGNFIEPIMILATNDGRKLGDRAANTMVIDKKDYFN